MEKKVDHHQQRRSRSHDDHHHNRIFFFKAYEYSFCFFCYMEGETKLKALLPTNNIGSNSHT